jgi:hypothetical protein
MLPTSTAVLPPNGMYDFKNVPIELKPCAAVGPVNSYCFAQPHGVLKHSLSSTQVPEIWRYPAWQSQEYDPLVFTHVPAPHGFVKHSLRSVHVTPLPANPGLHVQLYDPIVLAHVAKGEHGEPVAHSLISVQTVVPLNPEGQLHEYEPIEFEHDPGEQGSPSRSSAIPEI